MAERASLLLVDDSQSVLSFQKAALSSYYQVSTAMNGVEALERLKEIKPEAMVLDLSMPEMDGDAVLIRVRADEELRDMGVLILSTEGQRAGECLSLGADDFLLKPTKPEDLRARVAAVIEAAERRRASRKRAFLFFKTGGTEMGMPLSDIEQVLPMLALSPLPGQPDWILGWLELQDGPVAAADLSVLSGLPHQAALLDQKLLVLRHPRLRLALCVDSISDPEELDDSMLCEAEPLLPAASGLRGKLDCLARSASGKLLPVLRGESLFEERALAELARQLSELKPSEGKETHALAGIGRGRGRADGL